MRITKNISISSERIIQTGMTLVYLSMLTSCKGQPGPDALQTVTPDTNAIDAKRQRAIDSLGQADAKYLGDPLSSFKVNIPAEPDGAKPASTVSGTIFEVKTEIDSTLQASHLTLGLYVPDKGSPVPVLINHISDDPDSLVQTTVQEDSGVTTERYGIAAMPLDEQYLEAFIKGDVTINGPIDQFLKKNASGDVVPLYTILFNDITPDNVKSFVEELSKLQDPAKIQQAVLSRIYGVTFSDLATDRSIIIKLDNQNQSNIKDFIANLFFGSDMVAQAKGLSAEELTAQAPTPFEAPTAIPTPALVEVAPGVNIPKEQIIGFEARDTSGKLIYVEDINGKWIKAGYEVKAPKATAEDWTNVNTRLGTDFVINTDGTITGVEGLNIDKKNGEVTFNFNGKGPENYHIANIKVQEINGVKTLLVAGYAWNPESKSWEAFNPVFPMESPEAQLGWFTQADVPNGNWLRWHQRATENIDMKALFAKAVKPTSWITVAVKSDQSDHDFDGRKDVLHYGALWWLSPKLEEAWAKGESGFLTKEQFPSRTCQSSAFLTDMNAALFSNNMLNSDGSVTSLPSVIDVPLIWERRELTDLFSTLAEGCNVDQATIEASGGRKAVGLNFTIWPTFASYPDEELIAWLTDENGQFLKDPAAIARREAVINRGILEQSASLDLWGAFIAPVEALQYWRIE